MAEYIDKSTLLRSFAPIYEHDRYTGLTFETAKQIIADHINSLPTIDIVCCKDCKWYREKQGFCVFGRWGLSPNDYCSFGEREDEMEK